MRTLQGGATTLGGMGKAAILFSTLLTVYAMVGLNVVLPAIEVHFSDTPGAGTLVRGLVTCVGFTMIFGAPMAGVLAERFSKRRILAIAICLYGTVGSLGLIIDNLWLLIASRIVLGFATAAISTLLITLTTMSFDGAQRNKWLGWLTMTSTLGALILIPAAGALGRIGWRAPFALHLIAIPLLLLVLGGIPREAASAASGNSDSLHPVKPGFPVVLAISALVSGIVCTSSMMFVPFHLSDIGISDPTLISIVLISSAISGGISSAFFGYIRQRLSLMIAFFVGFVLVGAGFGLLGLAQSFCWTMIGQAVGGCGVGMLTPNMFSMAAVTGLPEHRPRNIGIVKGLFAGGPFFGQLALEPVAQMTNAGGAIVALGLTAFIAAIACATIQCLLSNGVWSDRSTLSG